jgi:hypothetical protein
MDLFLAISQGTGLALATGVRPFLPPLLAGALARADAAIDFSGSDYSFLESLPFLAVLLAIAVLGTLADRLPERRAVALGLAVVAVALGALEFAGSLAGEGHRAGLGLIAGAVCAVLGYLAASTFIGGAMSRLRTRGEARSASYLNLYADFGALVVALLAILLPPVSYVPLAFCAWLLLAQRRRAGRKYEGLRVLR